MERVSAEMPRLHHRAYVAVCLLRGDQIDVYKRQVQQGGVSLGGEKVTDIAYQVTDADFGEGYLVLKKGKKAIYKVVKK